MNETRTADQAANDLTAANDFMVTVFESIRDASDLEALLKTFFDVRQNDPARYDARQHCLCHSVPKWAVTRISDLLVSLTIAQCMTEPLARAQQAANAWGHVDPRS